ncbi:hypothetical protein BDN71DRAFT_1432575 [Pleurotus eryngii]|uniref:Uncharacterized protein n=1 Tax=Pleurotus eryngii TaxID=5323 RepID=A0A9P5ZX14_PLEER|nr:hypothetical protein BDN71DRAFT_1432575 [Pleurotus eryngii]
MSGNLHIHKSVLGGPEVWMCGCLNIQGCNKYRHTQTGCGMHAVPALLTLIHTGKVIRRVQGKCHEGSHIMNTDIEEKLNSAKGTIRGSWHQLSLLSPSAPILPSSMPHPYLPEDLQSLRKLVLVALVLKQANKWLTKSFNSSKTNIPVIRAALLDPANGFTTESLVLAGRNTKPSQDNEPQAKHMNNTITPGLQRMNNVRKMLRIYLCNDQHPNTETQMIPCTIAANEVNCEGCRSGKWRVRAVEVIEKLQEAPAVIINSVCAKVLYMSAFLTSSGQNTPHDSSKVQESCTLDLHVMVGTSNMPYTKQLKSYQTALNLKSYSSDKKEDSLLSGLPLNTKPLEISWQHLDDQEIQSLQDCVTEWPGIKQFKENHGQQMQNNNVIWQWSFTVNFLAKYSHKPCDVPGLGNQLVTKMKVYAALGVSETWLTQAEDLIGHINLYGRNGSQYAEEVAKELKTIRPTPCRSVWLYRFLLNWEKEHPVQL